MMKNGTLKVKVKDFSKPKAEDFEFRFSLIQTLQLRLALRFYGVLKYRFHNLVTTDSSLIYQFHPCFYCADVSRISILKPAAAQTLSLSLSHTHNLSRVPRWTITLSSCQQQTLARRLLGTTHTPLTRESCVCQRRGRVKVCVCVFVRGRERERERLLYSVCSVCINNLQNINICPIQLSSQKKNYYQI